jgi:drug/metabolite transporter (DMT)-like permease
MNLVQLPIGLLPSIPVWVAPTLESLPWILATGIAGLGSHFCLSRAMAYADATVVAPLDFLRLPLAAIVAWFLYSEPLSAYVFLGAVVIFVGNWINIRRGES